MNELYSTYAFACSKDFDASELFMITLGQQYYLISKERRVDFVDSNDTF